MSLKRVGEEIGRKGLLSDDVVMPAADQREAGRTYKLLWFFLH